MASDFAPRVLFHPTPDSENNDNYSNDSDRVFQSVKYPSKGSGNNATIVSDTRVLKYMSRDSEKHPIGGIGERESLTQLAVLFPIHISRQSLESTRAEEFSDQQSIGQLIVSIFRHNFTNYQEQAVRTVCSSEMSCDSNGISKSEVIYTKLIIGPGFEIF